MSFAEKINIWNDTVEKCKFLLSKGIVPDSSIKYDYLDVNLKKKYQKTDIQILNMDSINCGWYLLSMGCNPVVLNMADNTFPGGHVASGSGAQEESLFRRSNYFQTLHLGTGFYPLREAQLVYSPKVTIIKNDSGNLLSNFFNLSFIACPAIKKPTLEKGEKFTESDRELLIRKLKNILNVAYYHNHDSVVLGALGCGAWMCPQVEVAKICKQVVKEYNGYFKAITFAILDVNKSEYIVKNSNMDKSNFTIFKNVFAS